MTGPLLQGERTIARMCALSGVSRAGYYRQWAASAPREEDAAMRDLVQRAALAEPHYGYRRVTIELRRAGVGVNHKRVLRLMHEDNLLCLRRRAFVPATTDSNHGWQVVPNLTHGMILTGIDQLWVADITYIRMREEFAYLAVVLDAFSRRVIGWALEAHLQASLAISALRMAIAVRRPAPGSLIHHSDRGVQYACKDYTELLGAHDIRPSMSRIGCPYDNAKAESFMKTLKQEEVDGRTYRDIDEARSAIGAFLEQLYNRRRLHSALAYRPPVEFEANLPPIRVAVVRPLSALSPTCP
jgi:putative transposase